MTSLQALVDFEATKLCYFASNIFFCIPVISLEVPGNKLWRSVIVTAEK